MICGLVMLLTYHQDSQHNDSTNTITRKASKTAFERTQRTFIQAPSGSTHKPTRSLCSRVPEPVGQQCPQSTGYKNRSTP